MAPEQILDPRRADSRSDLYSLGAVLYEAVTGRKAFCGSGVKQVLDAHFSSKEAPQVPGSGRLIRLCNELLERMLDPEASRRFESPREMRDFLND